MARNVSDRVPVFSLGERIRKAREDLGLSQADFARQVFKSRDTIGNWEAGRTAPTYADIMLVSSVADVSLEWLAGELFNRRDNRQASGRITGESAALAHAA